MLRKGFAGRYGVDPLSIFALCFAVAFFTTRYLWPVGFLLIGYVVFRAMSRNLDKRRRELWAFMDLLRKIGAFFNRLALRVAAFFSGLGKRFATRRMKWSQRKEYVFPRCPSCKGTLRLPRHRGMLMVTCPVCGHEFKYKT